MQMPVNMGTGSSRLNSNECREPALCGLGIRDQGAAAGRRYRNCLPATCRPELKTYGLVARPIPCQHPKLCVARSCSSCYQGSGAWAQSHSCGARRRLGPAICLTVGRSRSGFSLRSSKLRRRGRLATAVAPGVRSPPERLRPRHGLTIDTGYRVGPRAVRITLPLPGPDLCGDAP